MPHWARCGQFEYIFTIKPTTISPLWSMCTDTCLFELSWNINKAGITVHMLIRTALWTKTKAVTNCQQGHTQSTIWIYSPDVFSLFAGYYSIWIFWAALFTCTRGERGWKNRNRMHPRKTYRIVLHSNAPFSYPFRIETIHSGQDILINDWTFYPAGLITSSLNVTCLM